MPRFGTKSRGRLNSCHPDLQKVFNKVIERFTLFAGYVLGIAESMGIDLIWGNDWNGDFNTKDTNFKDYPHFEIKNKK